MPYDFKKMLYESPGGNQVDGLPPARHSKFGAKVILNFEISAPGVDIRIILGPPEDIELKYRFLPKMILNIEFMINLPQRESLFFDLISLKNIIFFSIFELTTCKSVNCIYY